MADTFVLRISADIRISKAYQNHLLYMPGSASRILEIVFIKPRDWLEISQAIQALREQKIVILNLTVFDPEQAQRAVDFLTGGTYALNGHSQWIGENTFLFTPSCVEISRQSSAVNKDSTTKNSFPIEPSQA